MTKNKSIAFVCHPYHRGGVTRWMADAAIAVAVKGYRVYFVTIEPTEAFISSGGRETMLELLEPFKERVHIILQETDRTFELGTEAYRASVYRQLIRDNIPAGTPLIISDDEAAWNGACALADKYPVIGVLHGDQDYYYDKAKKYHKQLSVCVCVSGRMKRNLIAKCPGIDISKIAIIPCGINLPAPRHPQPACSIIRLIFLGRLTDYEKRAYDLVSICTELYKQGVPFHLNIAGNDESSAIEFAKNFNANGTSEHVSFHGWQSKEEVQELLDDSDILLLTSNSEGMPLVMMEALASGCGFAGTRVSGIEDYEYSVAAADCLSVFTIGDIQDAVNKIMQVALVPAALRQESARRLAEAEFSMDVCLGRYFKAIDGIKESTIKPSILKMPEPVMVFSKAVAFARGLKFRLKKK